MKRKYSIAFKKQVIEYIEEEKCTPYQAWLHFNERDHSDYSQRVFYKWFKAREKIKETDSSKWRAIGGGRKPLLRNLEEILCDQIFEMRLRKCKVTRSDVALRARILEKEHGVEFKASQGLMDKFLARHNFTLRRATNLTALTESQLIMRAVDYLLYLRDAIMVKDKSKILLMDETAVFFEDTKLQTIDIRGRRHVVMKSTGFSSMRITVVASMWADGRKAIPLLIHKGKNGNNIEGDSQSILYTTQKNAWVNQDILIKWIDLMFPLVDVSAGMTIIGIHVEFILQIA